MEREDIVVGMEVKLRDDIDKCTHTKFGEDVFDCDLTSYKGGDFVEVQCLPDELGDVRVEKPHENYIWVNIKHLRKIKGEKDES